MLILSTYYCVIIVRLTNPWHSWKQARKGCKVEEQNGFLPTKTWQKKANGRNSSFFTNVK